MSSKIYRVSPRGSGNLEKHLSAKTRQEIGELRRRREQQQLARDETDGSYSAPAPEQPESLCDQLWDETETLRQEALNTKWIQGIGHGNLNPNDYGGYTVQDVVYCAHIITNIRIVKKKTAAGPILDYFEAQEKILQPFVTTLYEQWHFASPEGIKLGPAAQKYASYEEHVAKTKKPEYFLISMLPCYRLWPWLAKQIKDFCPGVYQIWIDENIATPYEDLQLLIDEKYSAGEIEKEAAREVYTECMKGEVGFFKSGTVDE